MDLHDSDSIDLLVDAPASMSGRERVELLYMPGESLFGVTGLRMRMLGWTVFPQERDEARRPAVIDGRTLKWKPFVETPPSIEDTKRWSDQAAGYNTAVILGPSSGNTFCLDIDITDRELSAQVEELADEVFGRTVFRRVGNEPKLALFYRVEDAEELPPNRTYRLLEADGETVSSHMVEVLSTGKPITSHGHHHKTGRYFQWLDKEPTHYGPEYSQVTTPDQLDLFLERLETIRKIHRNAGSATVVDWEYSPDDNLQVPKLRQYETGTEWVEDSSGMVVDGREKFLYQLSKRAVRANPGKIETPEGLSQIKAMVFEQFRLKADGSGRWTDGKLREEIHSKVTRFAGDLRSGRITPLAPRSHREGAPAVASEPLVIDAPRGNELGIIRKQSARSQTAGTLVHLSEKDDTKRAERALQPDRGQIATDVQLGLSTALDSFFDQVYEEPADEPVVHPIHVLKAPTGAGKTTRTIRYIATDPRTKKWDEAIALGQEAPGPILFLLPTYNNIEELKDRAEVLNLDPSLDDVELADQAREKGLIAIDDLDAAIAELRRDAMASGLRTMIYRGKIAAGCQMQDKVKMLMDSGIGTSGLCRAKIIKKDEEPEEKLCVHYNTCPAIQQRKEIAKSHVVFLPHAFLTLSIPEELKNVRAVIADERIFTLFVHTTTFYQSTLSRGRKEPSLTKKERELGVQAQEILNDRDIAAKVAIEAMMQGDCPAKALAEYKEKRPKAVVRGIDLVSSAARVCGSAISANAMITPDISDEEIRELCAKPTGAQVREEYRFWKIIQERIEMLIPDLVNEGLAAGTQLPLPKKATGSKEMRIQRLIEEDVNGHLTELIRISWRSEPNWLGAPMLLLDASASPEIIGKIFYGRDVVTHETPAALNVRTIAVIDRTYANATIVAKGSEKKEREAAAKVKERVQQVIEAASSSFGYGRVVCGSSVALRRALNTAWVAPSNVDFCHFGAMRGLDFAKYHAAAVSVGRMEVPTRTIDGIVAALTYDDPNPETPYDRGDGKDPAHGGSLMLPTSIQFMPMRNGQDASVSVPMFPGRWGRIVQQQYREEELRQFVGRLRPVYREGEAPVWIAVSKVIPDGIVVDDVVTIEDMINIGSQSVYSWRAARKTDGVLQSDLMFAADPLNRTDKMAWRKELDRIGLNEVTGEIDVSNRHSWGYTPVSYLRSDGVTGFAFVRTEHKDPRSVAEAAFDKILGWDVEVLDVGTPAKPRQASQQRENDWVAEELGTNMQRQIDEQNIISKVTAEALMTQQESAFTSKGVPITATLRQTQGQVSLLKINELVAYEATEMLLARMQGESSETISSPVLGTDFEQIGETLSDDDDMSLDIDL